MHNLDKIQKGAAELTKRSIKGDEEEFNDSNISDSVNQLNKFMKVNPDDGKILITILSSYYDIRKTIGDARFEIISPKLEAMRVEFLEAVKYIYNSFQSKKSLPFDNTNKDILEYITSSTKLLITRLREDPELKMLFINEPDVLNSALNSYESNIKNYCKLLFSIDY